MAQPALDYFTKVFIAMKAESAEGTDAAPSTSVNTFDLYDVTIGTEFDKVERKRDRPYFTGEAFIVANKRAFVEGGFELCPPVTPGDATSAGNVPCEVVLFPSGMAVAKSSTNGTTIYSPISTAIPTITADAYHAGTLTEIIGARANISGLMMEVGGRFTGKVRIQGVHADVDEASLPTDGDYSAFLAPSVITYANSVMRAYGSTAANTLPVFLWGKSLSVDFGNELQTVQYTQKRVSGISDRNATFTAKFARTAKADFDVHALRDAGTQVIFDFTVVDDDGTSYSRLKIRGQIESIKDVDQDGYRFFEVTGPCIASDAGGDELNIEFGLDSLRVIGDLPDAAAGAYSQQLSLQGVYGSAVTWSLLSGSLPAGTSINATTGVVSGTATAGSTSGVIRATTTDVTGAAITADSSTQAIVIT